MGWLGLACETTREATTSTETYGRPVLENSYYSNVTTVTLLIRLLWYFRLLRICREMLAVFSFGRASAFYTALFTFAAITCGTARERRRCDTVNGAQVANKAIAKRRRSKFEHV